MHTEGKLATNGLRQGTRFPILRATACEHRIFGHIILPLSNVSRVGFMADARSGVERGDSLIVRLPATVPLEACCIWTRHQRAGFQFERPIPSDAFVCMIEALDGMQVRQTAWGVSALKGPVGSGEGGCSHADIVLAGETSEPRA